MKLYTVAFSLVVIAACSANRSKPTIGKAVEKESASVNIANPTEDDAEDKIVTFTKTYSLAITKNTKTSRVNIQYRLNGMKEEKNVSFAYLNYSDQVFPDTAIALIENGAYKKMQYCLIGDSLLILPLIVHNNMLSTYIVNLKTGAIIGNDIRTSLYLIWVYLKNNNIFFVSSDSPKLNDTSVAYVLINCRIKNNRVEERKRKKIVVKNRFIDDDNEAIEYKRVLHFID